MRRKVKGYFMLFRILPVMVWSLTGSLVGTSLAVLEGSDLNWPAFLIVLAIASLIQGYPTHIINEIFDWKSGADGRELREQKSGGSKVLQAKLLTTQDLWIAFALSHVALSVLILFCIKTINASIVYGFILPGYLAGIFYTLPPFRFSYRPFLGEWLGGFAGIFFLVLGSYYAQIRAIDLFAGLMASGLGLIYVGIMIFFHYLDFENDRRAVPKKNTTVVYLGLEGCRKYALNCLRLAAVILITSSILFQIEGILLVILSGAVLLSHYRADLRNSLSIIKWGKVITYSTFAATILFAAAADLNLILMGLPIILAFWAHKKFGKLTGLQVQFQ